MNPVPQDVAERCLASVVIVNYNYSRFLAEAIESALSQTYSRLEVIVVDDGSTDESCEVIRSYGNRIIPVLKENGGMASALNAGFGQSRGDFVLFLDSDDQLLPSALENAGDALSDSQVVKVHWPMIEIDAEGRETGFLVPASPLSDGDVRQSMIDGGPHRAAGSPTSGNAWSRRLLDQVIPMPEAELRRHADSYLNTLAPMFGRVRRLDHPQGRYRVHGQNDYGGRDMNERFHRNLDMYHYRARLLSKFLAAQGVNARAAPWENTPYYLRLKTRCVALESIASILPEGADFIWIDGGAWGRGDVIAGRRSIPFGADGNGDRPPDEQASIDRLEKLRMEGAAFVVAVKPALWWLTSRPRFEAHLRANYDCVFASDASLIFDLRHPVTSGM